jgi:hypothetical protein
LEDGSVLVQLDCQGLYENKAGLDARADTEIAVLAALLSSTMCLHSIGALNANVFQQVSTLVAVCGEMRRAPDSAEVAAGKANRPLPAQQCAFIFPRLQMLLRDAVLQSSDPSLSDYLERQLSEMSTSNSSDRTNIAMRFKLAFPRRSCASLVTPLESDQSQLPERFAQLRPIFQDEVRAWAGALLADLQPKTISSLDGSSSLTLSGSEAVEWCESILTALNGQPFVFKNAFDHLSSSVLQRCEDQAAAELKRIVAEIRGAPPLALPLLEAALQGAMSQCALAVLQNGGIAQELQEMDKTMQSVMVKYKTKE